MKALIAAILLLQNSITIAHQTPCEARSVEDMKAIDGVLWVQYKYLIHVGGGHWEWIDDWVEFEKAYRECA